MASNNVNNLILEAAKAASLNFPSCPRNDVALWNKYHHPEVCLSKPSRPPVGHPDRWSIYQKLMLGGTGASLIPNTETRICPIYETALESSPTSKKGFDTTWIVENTSSKFVVLAWVVNGVEVSPFEPGLSPMDDPKCVLKPGDWMSVPTFESFVYHVREVDTNGPGRLVLQHRAGMIPLGRKNPDTDNQNIDPEPFSSRSLEPNPPPEEAGRLGTQDRPCNIIDVGFRNEAGFPLSVFYAGILEDTNVPAMGFTCAEQYHFHMGLKAAPQDFMWDWASQTKYEGSYIGHTFVARRADDPSVVVDKYTLKPTRIIDCPDEETEQMVAIAAKQEVAGDVQNRDSCPNADEEDDTIIEATEGVSSLMMTAGLSGTAGFSK